MDNLLDIFQKLKLHTNSKIKITYLTKDNILHTKEVTLLDINNFQSIYIEDEDELESIPFISPAVIIKSIYLENKTTPIYHNPYLDTTPNPFLNYYEIKNKMFNLSIEEQNKLQEINRKINNYLLNLEIVQYETLFFSEKQKQEFEEFFNLLIKELTKYAIKKGYNKELLKISAGTTSIIYQIGDKIIKIGKPRRLNAIPYCEYILQPIVNKIYYFDDYPIHIEVTQKTKTINNKNNFAHSSKNKQFNEIVDILRKSLKEIGLRPDDLHPGNVGILLKDNKIHYDDIYYETSPEKTTSITNNNNYKILPKKSFVIIDLDSLEIEDKEKYRVYLESISKQPPKTLSKKREK